MRDPMVWTIRHPPNSVPNESMLYAPISTQSGMLFASAT
jgi:hypothetical protein